MNARLTVAAGLATVLASIALYPLLAGGIWFWGGIGVVIVVAAVGAATRRRAIPAILCFLAAIGAEFLYLNAVFAGRQSLAGLVPTAASMHHLQVLLHQAMAETHKYAPPVPPSRGIVLLTVGGIGLVAVLVDVLAVRLHRPAIAGLPLLVLFCVPLTTDARPGAVGGTLVFCAGMVGYLGLLSADGRHRLRLWGRLIHPWQDEGDGYGPDVRPLAAAGRRIGSAAVVLALALPLLIPGLKAHRLFSGDGNGKGNGGSHGISFPKPLDLLNSDLRDTRPVTVLNYHTTDGTPPYLQVYVLGNLTTNAWTMGSAPATTALTRKGFMPAVPGMDPSTTGPPVKEWITLGSNLENRGHVNYLPVPYAARQVKVNRGSNWRIDGNTLSVLSASAPLAGLHYEVLAKDVNPLPEHLRQSASVAASASGYLNVPPQYKSPQIMKLVKRITADKRIPYAKGTPYGKAVAIQNWFTTPGRFTYSLKVPSTQGPGALIQFLTKSKKGYCQQFAFGMAVLARLVGIPSRVVVGYTQGTFQGNDNWEVKTSDAHAWPELFFAGVGWLRFEPTPPNAAGGPGQATAIPPPYSTPLSDQQAINPVPGHQANVNPTPETTPGNKSQSGLNRLKKTAPGGAGGVAAASHHGTPPLVPVVIALLVVLLIAPATTRVVARRWRWWRAQDDVSRAHVAWHELRNDLTDYRIPYRDSETPRALSHRIATSLGLAGDGRDALARIARAEERASYAISPADSARLEADEALVRRAVARSGGMPARWLAVIAPPSALIPVRAGAQQLLDVFGWMELATTRLRRRFLPQADVPVLRSDKPAPA